MKYNEDELKIIQKCQVVMLKRIAEVCDKHNLDYFLIYGTALGAIRHKGFIPWDDDIDIALLQKDYEKFLEIAQDELGDQYFVQTFETDPNYPMVIGKVRINGVDFVEDYLKNIDMNHGLFIDVFPFFNHPDDDKERELYLKEIRKVRKLYFLKSNPYTNKEEIPFFKYLLKQTFKYFTSKILLAPFSRKKLYEKYMKLCNKYSDIQTNHVGVFSEKYSSTIDEMFPPRKVEFEGYEFKTFNKLEENMERIYGDYMKLPPEDKRTNHKPYYVNFEAARKFLERNGELEG